MALTPLEIHNKEFRKTFRGYSEEEVDEFLDEIVRDLEAMIRENAQLKDDLGQAKARLDQYQTIEATLQSTLVVAQQSADDLKVNARKEAELIVQEAQDEAERIVAAARAQETKLHEDMQEAQRQFALFRSKIRSALMGQLELLNEGFETPAAARENIVAATDDSVAADSGIPGSGAEEASLF